ncbi:MAG: type 1 glutamine amidotransferase [Pseudomonadota bacterium]
MFAALLADPAFSFEAFNTYDMAFPFGAQDCDAWLITGSRLGAYDDHPSIAPMEALIREIVARKKPLLGVCFGHQIIAQALGGQVEKWSGGWCLGPHLYQRNDGAVRLHAFHQDQVTRLPPGAERVATHPACENAGFRIENHVLTYQPHPEYTNPIFTAMVDKRRDALPPDMVARAYGARDAALDTDRIVAEMIAHLKKEPVHG